MSRAKPDGTSYRWSLKANITGFRVPPGFERHLGVAELVEDLARVLAIPDVIVVNRPRSLAGAVTPRSGLQSPRCQALNAESSSSGAVASTSSWRSSWVAAMVWRIWVR